MYDDLFMFTMLVRLGNFSLTAKYFNTSQPTITRRLQALEATLDLQLIKRNTRNLEITINGQQLYQKLQSFRHTIDSVIQEIKGSEHRERLRIALPPAMSFYAISPYLGKFLAEHQNLSLDLVYQHNSVDMVAQNLDLAINVNLPVSQIVKIRLLHRAYFQLYASPQYIQRFGQPTQISDLEQHTVIGILNADNSSDKILYARHIVTGEQIALKNSHCRIRSNEGLNIHQIINSGYAIGGLLDTLLNSQDAKLDLIKLLPEYTFNETVYYLIRDPDNKSPSLDSVIKFIEACFQRLKSEP